MPSSKDIQRQIEQAVSDWGKYMADELTSEMNKAINKRGSKVQDAALHFVNNISVWSNGVVCTVYAKSRNGKDASYWQWIEEGRRKGSRRPPSGSIGTDWMVNNNIDPRKVVQKYSKSKKLPTYANAAKQLSFMVSRSISVKGIKPKPYLNSVINQQNINKLREKLVPLMGEKFILIIKGL